MNKYENHEKGGSKGELTPEATIKKFLTVRQEGSK